MGTFLICRFFAFNQFSIVLLLGLKVLRVPAAPRLRICFSHLGFFSLSNWRSRNFEESVLQLPQTVHTLSIFQRKRTRVNQRAKWREAQMCWRPVLSRLFFPVQWSKKSTIKYRAVNNLQLSMLGLQGRWKVGFDWWTVIIGNHRFQNDPRILCKVRTGTVVAPQCNYCNRDHPSKLFPNWPIVLSVKTIKKGHKN